MILINISMKTEKIYINMYENINIRIVNNRFSIQVVEKIKLPITNRNCTLLIILKSGLLFIHCIFAFPRQVSCRIHGYPHFCPESKGGGMEIKKMFTYHYVNILLRLMQQWFHRQQL